MSEKFSAEFFLFPEREEEEDIRESLRDESYKDIYFVVTAPSTSINTTLVVLMICSFGRFLTSIDWRDAKDNICLFSFWDRMNVNSALRCSPTHTNIELVSVRTREENGPSTNWRRWKPPYLEAGRWTRVYFYRVARKK